MLEIILKKILSLVKNLALELFILQIKTDFIVNNVVEGIKVKKVLFVCNVLSHIYAFHLPYIEWFKQNGYEVHILTNAGGKTAECCDKLYDVGLERSPFSFKNISAYRTAKKIINSEKYDIVHCHTPMGGVIGRLASKLIRKDGAKVLYTGLSSRLVTDLISGLLTYGICSTLQLTQEAKAVRTV